MCVCLSLSILSLKSYPPNLHILMTLFFLHTPLLHSSKLPTLTSSLKPKKTPIIMKPTIPARDRVIDFGKHKGKMLGTLPSSYLKWVSNNLRARDFEQWAKLADQVLQDAVYEDRIEWEFAEKILHGDFSTNTSSYSLSGNDESVVSQLLEISERFGWDNEDKVAWSRVNFELLGTSKGGRIPRQLDCDSVKEEKDLREEERERATRVLSDGEERRRERRERVRLKIEGEKMGIGRKSRGFLGNVINGEVRFGKNQVRDEDWTVENNNPFPGREALLKKLLNRKRLM